MSAAPHPGPDDVRHAFVENLLALQSAAYEFVNLERRSAADRASMRDSVGEEVERRCRDLLAFVRATRGEPVVRAVPEPQVPAPEPEPAAELPDTPAVRGRRLNGAAVRDAIMRFRGSAFSESELVAELVSTRPKVKPFLTAMLASDPPQLRPVGKLGRAVLYEFVSPAEAGIAGPNERFRHRPPEKDPPAGTEARATGMPVRVSAAQKVSRRTRSTPGTRHQIVQRDRRWERQQNAKDARAREQREKAHAEAARGKKKK